METPASSPTSTERPSPPARSSTWSSNIDSESQSRRGSKSFRAPGAPRRASTLSAQSFSIAEEKVYTPRQATFASASSEDDPQGIQRTPTSLPEEEPLPLHGYPKLASFIGREPGSRIFKRFASLNARNLLYHQTKVTCLEHELNELEQKYADKRELHYKVHHLFSSNEGTPGAYELRLKYEEVSSALEKYNSLLLEQASIYKLPEPDRHFVDSLYNFIKNANSEDPEWMHPPENMIYAVYEDNREPVTKDLVALDYDLRARDPFTKFFTGTLLEWWHPVWSRFKKPDDDLNGYVYLDKTLARYMSGVVIIVASALPTCSIVVLNCINSEVWRLVFIVLFSVFFAACLTVFTDAKRAEVFVASATLAGVQVVFVGTAFGSQRSNG